MAPAHFAQKKNKSCLPCCALPDNGSFFSSVSFWCSSRQRIVLQQCIFSVRSFAASLSVTLIFYFFSMSDLTVNTVKAMHCQALRGQLSQRSLNPKGNGVKVFYRTVCWHSQPLVVRYAPARRTSNMTVRPRVACPETSTGTNASSASSGHASSTDLCALVRDEV